MKFTRKTRMVRYFRTGSWHFQYFGQKFLGKTHKSHMGMWVEYNPNSKAVWFNYTKFQSGVRPVIETKTVDGEIR